jgi:hypothetical protein
MTGGAVPPAAGEPSCEKHPRADRFIAEICAEFPTFRIIPKADNRFSQLIDVALRAVTFGAQDRYMTQYHTVIGNTLYVPASWPAMSDLDRVILLRHERVHLRQRRRMSFLLMAFVYLVPFFPLGLAYGRARIEWEAYCETLRAVAELKGLGALRDPGLRAEIIRRFTGGDYGWMWPFPGQLAAWYDRQVKVIEAELVVHVAPQPGTPPRQQGG